MWEKISGLLAKLENSRLAPLVQFVKFGIVGVSNTLISYGIEMLCYYALMKDAEFAGLSGLLNRFGIPAGSEQVKIAVVGLISFAVSVTNSFYWNSRYVFKAEEKRTHGQLAAAYFRTVASYALTGLILAPALKMWLTGAGMAYWLASLASLLITIPLNFLMNKFWAFRKKTPERTEPGKER